MPTHNDVYPDISFENVGRTFFENDITMFTASIAISLKRIADTLEHIESSASMEAADMTDNKTPELIIAKLLIDAEAADEQTAAQIGVLMISALHKEGFVVVSNDPAAIIPEIINELKSSASMIRTWIPEAFPANSLGQKHFVRVVMESVAETIDRAVASNDSSKEPPT